MQQAVWDKWRAEGKKAAHFSQWAKALEAYQIAWAIQRDWKLAANLGRAELTLRKYRDAAEHLSYVLREAPPSLSTDAPKEWNELRQMLQEARAKVAALIIIVEPPGADVLVNGLVVGKAPLPTHVFVDPGEVTVEARAEGFALGSTSIKALAGKEQGVSLALAATRPRAEPIARMAPRAAPPRETESAGLSASWKVGVAALSIGGASLVVGGVTCVMFVDKNGVLVGRCPADVCKHQSDSALLSERRTLGTVSTVTLVAGTVLATTGAMLLGIAPRTEPEDTAWVGPMIGAGVLGAQGRF